MSTTKQYINMVKRTVPKGREWVAEHPKEYERIKKVCIKRYKATDRCVRLRQVIPNDIVKTLPFSAEIHFDIFYSWLTRYIIADVEREGGELWLSKSQSIIFDDLDYSPIIPVNEPEPNVQMPLPVAKANRKKNETDDRDLKIEELEHQLKSISNQLDEERNKEPEGGWLKRFCHWVW